MARTPLLRALRRLARDHAAAEQLGISGRRAPSPAGGAVVLARGAPEADRSRRRGDRRRRADGSADASGPWRAGCADRHRRRRDRGAHRGPHAAGQGHCLDGLRGPPVAGRRPDAFGLDRVPGVLRRRAGRRALRGADRQRAQDDPHARQAFRAGDRRPAGRRAQRLGRTRTTSPAPTTPRTQADKDFQPVHKALQADIHAASYPTTYLINTPGGIALDNMSVYDWIESRVPGGHGSRFGQLLDVAYNIEYGAETTDQSALNLVYLLGYQASPGSFSVFGASDERFHIAGGNTLLPYAIRDAIVSSQGAARCGPAGGCRRSRRNADGTVALALRHAGRQAAGDRRPRRPLHELQRAADARLLAAPASTRARRRRSRSSGRVRTPSSSSSSRAGSGTRTARGASRTERPTRTPATRTPGT